MRAMQHADFLSLWEKGHALHPLDQGLLAIHAAFPEATSVADWPLGRRNRALAEMHCSYFGYALEGWTSCPHCGEKLEFKMDSRALAEQPQPQQEEPIVMHGERFRLPTSRDLALVAEEHDALEDHATSAVRLLRACRVDGGEEMEHSWSEAELEEAGEKMAAADPLAEIVLNFQCPMCKGACHESLDLPTFLWAELEALARRLAREVHALASAYGWAESEILALSDARRRLYLEMVNT